MHRIEGEHLTAADDGLGEEGVTSVVPQADAPQLSVGGSRVFGNAIRDFPGIEIPPVDAGQDIGPVVEVTDSVAIPDHDLGQVDFRGCKGAAARDLSDSVPGHVVVFMDLRVQIAEPVPLQSSLDRRHHRLGLRVMDDDMALVKCADSRSNRARLSKDAPNKLCHGVMVRACRQGA